MSQPGDGPPPYLSGVLSPWIYVPLGVVVAFIVIGVMLVSAFNGTGENAATASPQPSRRLPVYWKVAAGDTYSTIAARTGLTVDELETFNPYTDPTAIVPGQRLKLRLHVPKAKRGPLGPRFTTVRRGDTLDSIAARTGHDVNWLLSLNKRLKPETLQPGVRVRLRR